MSARPGHSLPEAVVALLSGAVICAGLAAMLRTDERVARARTERLARLETARITAAVLHRELAVAEPTTDLAGFGSDTVALRLFRGFAVVCGSAADGAALVVYAGERQPDPTRDSLLPLLPAGAPALPLRSASRAAGACTLPPAPVSGAGRAGIAEEPYAMDAGGNVAVGTPLLLFQPGIYALSGSALRVRHGDEGRQPLTGEWLDDRGTSLVVQAQGDAVRAHVAATLRFRSSAPPAKLRLPLPNAVAAGEQVRLP